jgi:F-type H+-transporting ATPase subunit delta
VISRAVAHRYAKAFISLAEETARPEEFGRQLRGVLDLIQRSAKLSALFSNPAVRPQSKRAVFDELALKLSLDPLCANAVRLLIRKDRFNYLEPILDAYEEAERGRLGIVVAEISSARSLSGEQKELVEKRLEEITGKSVQLRFKEDGELIGGLVVRLGSTIYDGSVARQLVRLKRRLVEEQ